MPRNWTESQLEAIETRGCDLLVSAGAGSGKTAVLTERIIRRLKTDKDSDITKMLIVTFTKAAAGELRERISAALSDALAENPNNKHIERQLLRLDSAKICTIHSFCLDLLRENFTRAGLTADFRIADEAEARLLKRSIMSELIDDCYNGKISEFEILADTLTGTKGDDTLEDIFLGLYNEFSSYREGLKFITDFANELEADSKTNFMQSRCGKEIAAYIVDSLRPYLDCFTEIIPWMESDEKLSKAYVPSFSYDAEFIRRIQEYAYVDYSSLKELMDSYNPPRLGSVRGEKDEDVLFAKENRIEFKKKLSELSEKFFSLPPEKISENQVSTAKMLNKLAELLILFDEHFTKEKRRRSIVDFNDLERLTVSILLNENVPTDIAISTSKQFDEIFIDEYQDVNSLQDAIFYSISRNNRFMVGDVKQSIYGFRGAEPTIFESYREKFSNGDGKTIFLSNNFRCDKNIIDFTNMVSECIFMNATGTLPYYSEDNLVHSKVGDEQEIPISIALFEKSDTDETTAESEYIASEINRLINEGVKDDGSRFKYSDFAILMRSAANRTEEFREVFAKNGIPIYNNTDGDFFENAEVLLALCLLNVIDDPHRDIYLAGLLKSPLFGFSLDELTLIRRKYNDGSLFDSLKMYTLENGFEKGEHFISTLKKYQKKAEELSVDKLIWYLYSDTDLPALVYGNDENGTLRRANLTLLYEYARRFESSSFKGLYNFIRYINDILADKAKLETAKVFSESSDTVKLMTIHQSKGLEFPVVFVCGCGKKFNESDLRQNTVSHRSLGIAMKLLDSTGFARFDTPIRQSIVKKLADSQLEEEMRVLYVATTRARERLYITAEVSESSKLLDKCAFDAKQLSRSTILQNGGYIKWILTSLEVNKHRYDNSICEVIFPTPSDTETCKPIPEIRETHENVSYDELLRERFDFVYPKEFLTKLPAKLSVSELFPTVLDEDTATLESEEVPEITAKVPLFMQETPQPLASAAERGTATHCFMQFCDFERFKNAKYSDIPNIISDECMRLGEEKFLSPSAVSLVNKYQLKNFFTSNIFAEICASNKIYREHRFNVKLPAENFTSDNTLKEQLSGEFILVQGVMDCFFENSDGSFTLVDYKTDHIPRELDRESAVKMLKERHKLQLEYYKTALKLITKKEISRVVLYSFGLGEAIEI